MSLTYHTTCDLCGFTVDSWPEGVSFDGWAIIQEGRDGRKDFCPSCWQKLQKAASIAKTAKAKV